MSETKCPTCGDDSFDSGRAMKIHHSNAHGESIAKEDAVCISCDEPFKYYSSNRKGVYCRSCIDNGQHHKDQIERLKVECSFCGTEKEIRPSRKRASGVYYCGIKCRNKHQSRKRKGKPQKDKSKKVSCTECKSSISVTPSVYNHNDNFFCNSECYDNWNSKEYVSVSCSYCGEGKDISKSIYNEEKDYFCGNGCRGKYRTVTGREYVECAYKNCSEEIYKKKSEIKDINFCSKNCQIEWLSSEQNPRYNGTTTAKGYGKGWAEARKETLERDDYECQICGKNIEELGREPDVHHLTPVDWFENTEGFVKTDAHYIENLVCLCNQHHHKYEYSTKKLKEELPSRLVKLLEFEDPEPLE